MTKLIIFDLDGTLLNSIEDIAFSTNFALAKHNFPTHEVEAYRYFVGNGVTSLIEKALPETARTKDIISMVRLEFVDHYATQAATFTKPYPGIADLLTRLSREGYMQGVASNKMHKATVSLVKRYFPDVVFFNVLGQREGIPVKPNPQILEEIISNAGVQKNEVLYVGDSGVDVATANNAKVPFAGVLWGFRPQEELVEIGATQFVASAEELYQLIIK